MSAVRTERTIFTIRVAASPGAAGLHALRALLKRLLRDHGFICLHTHEEHDAAAADVNTITEKKENDDGL
jgi:hypothetical protein